MPRPQLLPIFKTERIALKGASGRPFLNLEAWIFWGIAMVLVANGLPAPQPQNKRARAVFETILGFVFCVYLVAFVTWVFMRLMATPG